MISLLFFVCFISFIITQCQSASTGAAHGCLAQYLQQNGILETDFPSEPAANCFLISTIISTFEDAIYKKFNDKEGINADCVKTELKSKKFFDHALKKEVIEMSKLIDDEKADAMLKKTKIDMKDILENVAVDCKSDPKWAGIFDDVLGVKNTSLAVLEQDYCYLKNSLDKNLIKIQNIDRNPDNIDTSMVDCDALVKSKIDLLKDDMKKKYEEQGLGGPQIECTISKLTEGNFPHTMIAIGVLEKLNLPRDVLQKNKEDLSASMQHAMLGVFRCVLQIK